MIKIHVNQIDRNGLRIIGRGSPSDFSLPNEKSFSFVGDISYSIFANLVSGGVIVESNIEADLECVCGRCLAVFRLPVRIPESFHFFENPSSDEIDLTAPLREDILMALPQNFICAEDCKGLCTSCGANLNAEECNCRSEETGSEAWRKLDGLLLDEKTRSKTAARGKKGQNKES